MSHGLAEVGLHSQRVAQKLPDVILDRIADLHAPHRERNDLTPKHHPTTPAVGALVPGRTCGPCTACCRVPAIEVLAKPAGVLCRHSTGTACGIYQDRPEVCVRWYCLWRKIGALPNALRPDRSGVIFAIEGSAPCANGLEGACVVGRAVEGAGAIGSAEATEAFAMFVREGSLPVWKVSNRKATLMRPDQRIQAL